MYERMQTCLTKESVPEIVWTSGRQSCSFSIRIVCLPTRAAAGYLVTHFRSITSCPYLFHWSYKAVLFTYFQNRGSVILLLFSVLSDDRSKASSKTILPHSAIQSLLFQMRVSPPVLKVIQ